MKQPSVLPQVIALLAGMLTLYVTCFQYQLEKTVKLSPLLPISEDRGVIYEKVLSVSCSTGVSTASELCSRLLYDATRQCHNTVLLLIRQPDCQVL